MYCPKCAKKNNKEAKFCQECGFPIHTIIKIINASSFKTDNRLKSDSKVAVMCPVKGCDEKNLWAKGFCRFHYERQLKGYALETPKHVHVNKNIRCSIEGCKRDTKGKYCSYHWYRVNNDLPMDHERKKKQSGTVLNNPVTTDHYTLKKNRLVLLKKYPKCQKCNKQNSIMVKHMDGDLTNHKIENLMALCNKCRYLVGRKNSKFYRVYGYNIVTLQKMLKLTYAKIIKLGEEEVKKRITEFEKTRKFGKRYQNEKQKTLKEHLNM